jgi:hypothetical protein
MYEDEPHDYGFDLPDTRHEFITKDGGHVSISVQRHWYTNEDDEQDFKVSFTIIHKDENGKHQVTELPIGIDESKACDIAHFMYKEDVEASDEIREMNAMYEVERRMGA